MGIPKIWRYNLQQYLTGLIKWVYEKIFNTKTSSEVDTFIDNLSYLFTGTMLATALSFAFNIYAGRVLGPIEYGKFTLVQSIAMFLQVQMLLGFSTAMVKYNSEDINSVRQKKIISTTYLIVLGFTCLTSTSYFLLAPIISELLQISIELFYLAILFAVLFVFYHLTSTTLQGLHQMKMYSKLKPIYSIILLSCFLVLLHVYNIISFESMFISTCIANLLIGLFIFKKIHKYIGFKLDLPWTKTLSKYSILMIFADLSFVLQGNIDRIFINKYLFIDDVGLYTAYYYASINVINILLGIFITAFFPTICKFKQKEDIFKKVNRLLIYIILVGLPLTLASQNIILRFYGDQYVIDYFLMILFAIAAVLTALYRLYIWTFNSTGIQGASLNLIGNGVIAISNVLLNVLLIPLIGLKGAVVATIVSYIIGISLVLIQSKRDKYLGHQ
ncbi:MAG: oligosaccharide flippase family protein [Methanolobus sp.]|uniref:oligosaccharide flippase family protein n=1 Tax=Methanolobus sp. TaxID=1874737 RepID=UPI0027308C03|nr:oligosaccharide flippase family protein [Methanolobus sp.]MDP2218376.1 oligosaccharide flippase family protein [Methanolobus sp.]